MAPATPAALLAAFLLARALAEVTCAPTGFRGVLAAQQAALREAVLSLATELQAQARRAAQAEERARLDGGGRLASLDAGPPP